IGNLLNLKYLNLSRNEINFLPKSIESLKSLEELYLGESDLKMDPKILKDLENNGVKIYYF
ncbi:MAG: leucine-rich repeat domain-containing protein, partial [Promethearchaeota archaeon]